MTYDPFSVDLFDWNHIENSLKHHLGDIAVDGLIFFCLPLKTSGTICRQMLPCHQSIL